ncbi:MAG: molecular chaperone TorD family protein [Siculibacillus sp.]|nr:molecular chaperone TorD family protein [Siculibacillus sp.]
MNAHVGAFFAHGVEQRSGVARDLRLLALLHDREPTVELLEALRARRIEDLFALPLADERGLEALDFFRAALSEKITRTDRSGIDELAADFAAIYLNHTHRVAPSESPWIDPEGLTAQQPMFEVRDWYRHWGLEAPNWRERPDDHLVVQLGFIAHLLDLVDKPAALLDAACFLDRHLLRWYGSFADGVARRSWTAYWAAVANLTAVHLDALREWLGRSPGCERVDMESVEAEKSRRREAAIAETCASAGAFVPGAGPTL